MKIAVLGDIHGRNIWKNLSGYDKIIFLGDYFDSFDIKPQDQISNFKDILEYRKNHDTVLLLGNHDYHYLSFTNERYTGFQPKYYYTINRLLMENLEYFQIGYKHNNFLFSHAGVTQTWWKNITDEDFDVELLNDFFKHTPTVFKFQRNKNKLSSDSSGDNIFQGPLWVRPNSLAQDSLTKYTHIVGHTQHDKMTIRKNCVFIDTLEYKKHLLINNIIEEVCL